MTDTGAFDDVLSAAAGLSPFRDARRVDGSAEGGVAAVEASIAVEGREATLRLVLDASFPLVLPRFFLRPWDALGFIPHVDTSGFVCFADPDGLVLDRRRPLHIIEEALDRVVRVLADGVSGRNRLDFADEFEAYWRLLPDASSADSVLEPPDHACRIIIAIDHATPEKHLYVAAGMGDISAFQNGAATSGKVTVHNALYLPLAPGTPIVPPRPDAPFWTASEAREALLPGLSAADRARMRKLLRERTRHKEFVIVNLPRPSGGATLFGVRYDDVFGRHPLAEGGTASRLVPLRLERLERSYLVRRGGGAVDLGTKRVLLAGCGAVGGHVALGLAHAGVLDLTLVDHDELTAENSFRHVLGRRYWGKNKAAALGMELESELPYVRLRLMPSRIEAAIADGSLEFRQYDLVVLALGNPTVELAVNERLHELQSGPAGLFTWVEPLGIGGHVLLAHNADGCGCFECLYTPADDTSDALANRAAIAASGQSFGRALSGCGSLYTPYGASDAARTAEMAVRLAIDALTGTERGNPLHSWKGDPTAFCEAGFHLAPRFETPVGELSRLRFDYASPRCAVCGVQ